MCRSPPQTISAARQARAWVDIYMGMRIGNRYKLPLSPAGAMFCSPHRRRRPPVLLNTDKGATIPDQGQSECQVGGAPPFFACKSLRDNHILFKIFDFLILNPTAGYLSTSTYSFNIQTPVVAQYGLSNTPERVFTRHFIHSHRYIAVAWIQTHGKGKLGKARNLRGTAWELIRWLDIIECGQGIF